MLRKHGWYLCKYGEISSWGYKDESTAYFTVTFAEQAPITNLLQKIQALPIRQLKLADMLHVDFRNRYYDEEYKNPVISYLIYVDYIPNRHITRNKIAQILDGEGE